MGFKWIRGRSLLGCLFGCLCILSFTITPSFSFAEEKAKPLSFNSTYQKVIEKFLLLNGPLVQALGLNLSVVVDTENPSYFGGVNLEGNQFAISIGDDFPLQGQITPKALAFALCHELGHLLGGAPKKKNADGTLRWASAEGQADFYAAKTCLPKLFNNDFPSDLQVQVIQAGLEMLTAIHELVKFSKIPAPALESADLTVVAEMNLGYPTLQCRLDTIRKGATGKSQPACWYRSEFPENIQAP